jgi:glycosyltransferase involved in cell wall biosynthesis
MSSLTIITAVRNGASSLGRCLDSIAPGEAEQIVIDGGSTDGTCDVIRERAHRLAWWRSEPDDGIADAFNKGLRRAGSGIIGILNADDWYEPGVLRAVRAAFERSDADVVHGRVRYWREGRPAWVADGSHRGLRRSGSVNHPSVFVRAEVYRRFGLFDTSYRLAMDYEIMLRWLVRGVRFAYLPTVLANMSLGGISDRRRLDALHEVRRAQRTHLGGPGPEYAYHWLRMRARVRGLLERIRLRRIVDLHGQHCGDMRKSPT